MRLENTELIKNIKVINADYGELIFEGENNDETNKFNIIGIEEQSFFNEIFSEHKKQISAIVNDDLNGENILLIEKLIESFLDGEGHETNKFNINNFTFDITIMSEFFELNKLDLDKRMVKFEQLFLIPFKEFILKHGYRNFPYVSDGKLICYKDGNNSKFRFEYDKNVYRNEGKITELTEKVESSKYSIFKILEEAEFQDIIDNMGEDTESYIIDLFDIITHDKNITGLDIKNGEFGNNFEKIKKYLKENSDKLNESNCIFSIIIVSLVHFIDKTHFSEISSFEKNMNIELNEKGIDDIVYDEDFFKFMKQELHNIFI